MVDSLLDVVHHVARWSLAQEFSECGMQTSDRIVNIALFPGTEYRMTERHKELQCRLLTQNRLGIDATGIAKQRGQ